MKCHGCKAAWDLPDSDAVSRCPECALVVLPPPKKAMVGTPETVDPPDHVVIGIAEHSNADQIVKGWLAFLNHIQPERYPSAFRQGRSAYERLRTSAGLRRTPLLWAVDGECFLCGEMKARGFPSCLLCRSRFPREQPREKAAEMGARA